MAVFVGTCSWTDKAQPRGPFYPPGCTSAEARLRFYASQFPLVEVDSSHYALPSQANAERWCERTPPGFGFNIKAFRLFTGHPTPVSALPKDLAAALGPAPPARLFYAGVPAPVRSELWRRFLGALDPLAAAGKLKLVHFQFPPWLVPNQSGHAHVRHCVDRMEGRAMSVEFRHRAWFEGAQSAATLAFERELGVVHTVVDAPPGFANSVPAVWEATDPRFALVRLHGRNAAGWNAKGPNSASRYDYSYTAAELAALVPRIAALQRQAMETHVVFNNTVGNQGQRNAQSLRGELANAGICLGQAEAMPA